MRIQAALIAGLIGILPMSSGAETLGDIRRDLASLMDEVASLKAELDPSGAGGVAVSGAGYDRAVAIEAELQRLTGLTEEMDFRIRQVVKDGTNRIGDLEFRICELEPGCDIGNLGNPTALGGGSVPAAPSTPAATRPPQTDRPQLAVGEETDLRRAQEALANGDFRGAADQFTAFRQTYPGSPLEPEVLMGLGAALEGQGDVREAARAYLDAFSGYPDHEVAPAALTKLGASLGALGKVAEACVTLGEVGGRYPDAPAVSDAQAEMARFGCS
ncbi:tol-pal system protein YbgF [Pseudoprimorskyibacter insulae]|uniref:Cell division coordinator CpoB n=1 Tax=Pseudoprimorskyibacter insulae TaxID=1695997 RepID=A0A2R8AVC9_9RHOB|nr:tol-pal system protein YbgF [Pseudoprimorskyibacter insulae]SPF79981.1 Outer membrane protein assembly factor BamD [Pseudoprimorskyibacter insulae]